jgi:3-ketoacyl-CoA synthase
MRQDIQAYHLGGMGCGNGVIAVGLVRDLLQAHPNANVVFVPCEIVTYAYYPGFHARYCVANCIFRMGAAAALMSNKRSDARRAKYRLLHAERRHTGQNDEAYGAVRWGPDPDGVNGLYLSRAIVQHAGDALEGCLKAVTPKILTWSQLGQGAANLLARAVYPRLGWEKPKSYQPDFTQCVQHFSIHAGGYAVLKGIQAGMKLPPKEMIPSFAALRDYGNTSSSTTWYIMGYIESCRKVKKGDVTLQIGMGSGMKAGVAVWKAMRDIGDVHPAWQHLSGCPLTEADLPRAIDEDDMLMRPSKPKPANPTGGGKFSDAATARVSMAAADGGVALRRSGAAGHGAAAAAPPPAPAPVTPPPATRTSSRRTRAAA